MRTELLALLALGSVAAIDATNSVEARDYPFCIKGRDYDQALGDCSFMTYQQCMASASGRYAYCDSNPFYSYATEPQPRQRGQRARRYQD
jgi:hypothetical protein